MATFDDVLGAAQGLDVFERIRLIDALRETVAPEDWPAPSREWIAGAQRRSADYDAGKITATPWPEVRARARRQAGLDE